MKAVLTVLTLLLPLNVFAAAKVTMRTGCSDTSVQYAQEKLDSLNKNFNAGNATGIDVTLAKIQLADTRYCAGAQYSTEEYCKEKTDLLQDMLDMRTRLLNGGIMSSYVVEDSKTELAQFKSFCAIHKDRD